MICPSCNKEIPDQPQPTFCPHCGERITPEPPKSCPWEERERLGFITSLTSTLKESLLKPGDFFRKTPVTGGLGSPLVYAIIWGTLGMMFGVIWQILFGGVLEMIAQPLGTKTEFRPDYLLAIAVLSPLIVIISIFIISGILHLCLMLIGGNRKGFEATFRVVSYSYGAQVFSAIPLCGGIIGAIWMIVIEIIGLKESHGISGGKATLAVFLPLIFCCILIAVFIAILIPIIIGALGSIPTIKGVPI
ncbi:MAG: YIP1 family protein [Nitrospirae bacterium]|nr:YIP1 family protein [Nitrospirota bacterium]